MRCMIEGKVLECKVPFGTFFFLKAPCCCEAARFANNKQMRMTHMAVGPGKPMTSGLA